MMKIPGQRDIVPGEAILRSRAALTPLQQANLERTYSNEFMRRIKAGEPAPFAGMMAARFQLIERNRILGEADGRWIF